MDDETLSKLEEIAQIPHINSGGCGIVMLALYRYLRDSNKLHGDEKFVYLYLYEHDIDLITNRRYLKGEGVHPSSCCHAALQYNNELWHGKGTFKNYYPYIIELPSKYSEDFVVSSINNTHKWNSTFDRNECIPIIESILNVKLNDIQR